MEFICNKTMFLKALNDCSKLLSKDNKAIYIEARDNAVTVATVSSDVHHKLEFEIGCEVTSKGGVVVDLSKLPKILKNLKSDFINFKLEDESILISSDGFEIRNVISETYTPSNKKYNPEGVCLIPSEGLIELLKRTKNSMSVDKTKPILCGTRFEISKGYLRSVAIDGYRLSIARARLLELGRITEFSISSTVTNLLLKVLPKDNTKVEIRVDADNIIFKFGNIKIMTVKILGEFVNYKAMLPRDCNTKITVDKKELQDTLKAMLEVSQSTKNQLVSLDIIDGKLDLIIITDMTEISKTLGIKHYDGDNLNIAFNCKYLLEGIEVLDCKEVTLEFTTNVNPCIIEPVDGTDYTYLVLPVRRCQV